MPDNERTTDTDIELAAEAAGIVGPRVVSYCDRNPIEEFRGEWFALCDASGVITRRRTRRELLEAVRKPRSTPAANGRP